MELNVKADMVLKVMTLLGGTPGFSHQATDIGSKHRAGMIETKERIKTDFLELSLPNDTTSLAFDLDMLGFWKGL